MSDATVTPRLIAGIGCRRDCPVDELLALVDATLQQHGYQRHDLRGLASVIHKRDEPGLLALGERLGLDWTWLAADQLVVHSPSTPLALVHSGATAVAEPCALSAALCLGPARLLGERNRSARATCALARLETELSP